MSRIRGRDTKPELLIRATIHRMGYRFRLQGRSLPGRPDIVFARRRKVIFVHGCFWHRHHCPNGTVVPKTRTEFWTTKFRENQERDARNLMALRERGWSVLVLWECEIGDARKTAARLKRFLGPTRWAEP